MQEILNKLSSLCAELAQKIENNDKRAVKLSEDKVKAEAKARSLEDREAYLNRRAEIIKDFEDIAELEVALNAKTITLNSDKAQLSRDKARLQVELNDVKVAKAEVESMKDIFIKKNKSFDERLAQLELDKKLMKEKVLDELKGKL